MDKEGEKIESSVGIEGERTVPSVDIKEKET